MALLSEILPRHWPGAEWRLDADDYSTLWWAPGNAESKPTEAEIRAFSSAVDADLAAEAILVRQQAALQASGRDAILKAFEVLIKVCVEQYRVINDIRNTAVAGAHTGNYTAWNQTVIDNAVALRDKIAELRNIT